MSLTKHLLLAVTLIGLALLGAPRTEAQANRTAVLVLAEDGDSAALPRDNRINRAILNELENQMNQRGYDVFTESAVTSGTVDFSKAGRIKESDLINIARNNVTIRGAPITIRVATVFNTFAMVNDRGHTAEVRIQITGRAIDPQSGNALANFRIEDPAGGLFMKPDCAQSKDCLQFEAEKAATELAMALGEELGRLIDNQIKPQVNGPAPANVDATKPGAPQRLNPGAGTTTYFLTFTNFTGPEMSTFEKYLVTVFPGYKNHNVAKSIGRSHNYTYWSLLDGPRLRRDLEKAMAELKWQGNISKTGNNFTIEKSTVAGKRR